MAKKKRKLRTSAKAVILLLVIIAVLAGINVARNIKHDSSEETAAASASAPVSAQTPEGTSEPEYAYYTEEQKQTLKDTLAEDQGINSDVVAYLDFPGGLISQPVLLGTVVNEYLYKDWKTGEASTWGSIAIDPRNNLSADEMNTIIYGHYVYRRRTSDRSLVFTPLSELLEQENYEANQYVSLTLPHEIRYYQIASVYDCPMEDVEGGQVTAEELQFNLTEYDEAYFETYMNAVKEHEYYDTGVKVNYGDKLLSLATCIEDHPESREIVLCKEIGRESY